MQMKRIATRLIAPALVGGVSFLMLAYVAIFSVRQSIVLALILIFLERYISKRAEKPAKHVEDHDRVSRPDYKFVPYHVRIDPRWEQLLCDFHLIGKAEEWDQVKESVWAAQPYGFCCTVLQEEQDGENGLIYRGPKLGEFAGILEFCDVITPIQFGEGEAPCKLRIFMKPGVDCYDLGIIVPEKWWNRVKTSCPSPIEEKSGEMWYESELTLARIPHAEFAWYRQPQRAAGSEYDQWSQEITSERCAERNRCGGKDCELSEGWPQRIEQVYFEVQHKPI
jgi:hypothetical protein